MRKRIALLLALVLAVGLLPACAEEPVELTPGMDITPEELSGVVSVTNISPYTGIHIEKGDDENKDRVENVTALKFTNTGDTTIADAHFVFSDGSQELNFYLQMLPAGSVVTLVEYDKKTAKTSNLQYVDSQINYLSDAIEDPDGFEVLESEYGSLIVENKTKQELDKVEIYYRRAFEDGTLGGICYVEVLENVGIGDIVYADPGYWSDKCAIVNILLYPDVEDSTDDTDDTVVEIFPETN